MNPPEGQKELVDGVEVLYLCNAERLFWCSGNPYPKFLVAIARRVKFCKHFDGVLWKCHVQLREKNGI